MNIGDVLADNNNNVSTEVNASQHAQEMYEKHVKRLLFILDQEQQARLRVETKLEEARVRPSNNNCILK